MGISVYIIKKKLKLFSAAHRLLPPYQGKCLHLHGHNYQVEVTLQGQQLDQNDLLIDFSIISKLFNAFVQEKLDHAILISSKDTPLLEFANMQKQKHFILEGSNTSAETLSKTLYASFKRALQETSQQTDYQNVRLSAVTVWETPSASATFQPESQATH